MKNHDAQILLLAIFSALIGTFSLGLALGRMLQREANRELASQKAALLAALEAWQDAFGTTNVATASAERGRLCKRAEHFEIGFEALREMVALRDKQIANLERQRDGLVHIGNGIFAKPAGGVAHPLFPLPGEVRHPRR